MLFQDIIYPPERLMRISSDEGESSGHILYLPAKPWPTVKEVRRWIIHTKRHSSHVEYYCEQLGLDIWERDEQHPHDLVGLGNKLEFEVIMALSIQHRSKDPVFFKEFILPAIEHHRQQNHHVRWNHTNPDTTEEDWKMGAIDAICSLLEPREYQGGVHTFREIKREIIDKDYSVNAVWLWAMNKEMKHLPVPALEKITLMNDYNIGISAEMHERIQLRIEETLELLKKKGYWLTS